MYILCDCYLSPYFSVKLPPHSLSMLDCRWVVAPSMLTDPSQHSKHQKERALSSWRPAPPSIFADDLVVSFRCQTVLSADVTWLRDVGLGGRSSLIHMRDVAKRECLLRLTASFIIPRLFYFYFSHIIVLQRTSQHLAINLFVEFYITSLFS